MTTGSGEEMISIPTLKAAEPYQRSLLDRISDAICICDREWRVVYLNPAAFQMLGFIGKKPEEVLERSIWELRPDIVKKPFYQHFHRVIEQQVPVQFEVQDPLKGRWFEFCCYPTLDGMAIITRETTAQKEKLRKDIEDRVRAAETLRQRVEELETIMDVVPAVVFVAHDPLCDIITGNKMANQFYEAASGENVSANLAETRRISCDGREVQAEELPMQQAVKGKEVRGVELEVELPSGRRVTAMGGASPLLDSEGKVRGCVGAFVDISELKRAERALRESEERFRAMASASPNLVGSGDAAGKVDYLNDRWYQHTGLTPEQSLGLGFLNAFHPDDAQRIVQTRQKVMESGNAADDLQCRIRRASDGSYRWHLGRYVPLRDAEGKVVRWYGTWSDIEELKEAQAQATERETWFRTLFDTIPMSAVLIEPYSRKVLQFNDAAAESLGYTREEVTGLTLDAVELTSSQQLDRQFAERLRSLAPVVFEKKLRAKSGAIRDFVVHSRFLTMNGRLVINSVLQDITEKKASEAALLRSEKLASVGRMAATVAHEINNPLEAVTNCVYLINGNPNLPPELKEYADIAERELHRIAHIAQRTLGFYRENRKPAVTDVRTLVDEVVELYNPIFTRKDIRLKIEHNGSSSEIFGRAGEIRQVLSNLLTNAVDASHPRGIVRVHTSHVSLKGRGYVRVTIADTGTGIPAVNRSRIFEPFFTTKEAVGNGLGLWVSKKIIERHKGRIRARSIEGKGTVFSIFVPCPE